MGVIDNEPWASAFFIIFFILKKLKSDSFCGLRDTSYGLVIPELNIHFFLVEFYEVMSHFLHDCFYRTVARPFFTFGETNRYLFPFMRLENGIKVLALSIHGIFDELRRVTSIRHSLRKWLKRKLQYSA